MPFDDNDHHTFVNSKYYDDDNNNNNNNNNNNKVNYIVILHLKIASLNIHAHSLSNALSMMKFNFSIIGIRRK